MKRIYRCLSCNGPMSWRERCETCGARRTCIGTLQQLPRVDRGFAGDRVTKNFAVGLIVAFVVVALLIRFLSR